VRQKSNLSVGRSAHKLAVFLFSSVRKFQNSEARADSSPDPSSARTKCKKQISRGFAKSFSPENSFRKTEFELKPRHTARILGGQNPKKKNVLSILEKTGRAQIRKARNIFSFWGCRVRRGGGGAFVERTILVKATTRFARAIHYRF